MIDQRGGTLGAVAAGVVVVATVATLSNDRTQAQTQTTSRVPVFEVDPTWPKLPNDWVVGHVASVAVDSRDHVFMLHRPNTIPEAQRSKAAPPVLEFDATGKFVNAWGGPGPASTGRTASTASPSTTRTTCGSAAAPLSHRR